MTYVIAVILLALLWVSVLQYLWMKKSDQFTEEPIAHEEEEGRTL